MSRTVNMEGPELPDNPAFLEFKTSDGNASRWPANTTQIVDGEGCVNYYEYLPPENGKNVQWRIHVAEAVAKVLKLAVGTTYVLNSFPAGYRLFDHKKGPAVKPRQDLYLMGAPGKRFRTIHEFIFHAAWLLNDMKGECRCRYCSKRPQKEVNAELVALRVITATPSVSMSPGPQTVKRKIREHRSRAKEPRRNESKTYAAVRPAPKAVKPSPGVLKQHMLVDRDNDLRAMYSTTSMDLRRWFRESEVVWCVLEVPIAAPENPAVSIQFWPGVVEEIRLKVDSMPRSETSSSAANQSQSETLPTSASVTRLEPGEDSVGPRLDPSDQPVPWTVRHSTRYKIQLLAVSHSYVVDDHRVLPYAAHIPSEELISIMQAFDPSKLLFEKDVLSQFNPCPGPVPPSFSDTIPAYAAALQIASTLSGYWCLTDEYEVKYSVVATPPSSPKPARLPLPSRLSQLSMPRTSSTTSLEVAINQASKANAQPPINVTSHSYHRNVQTVDANSTQGDTQRTSQRLLGMPHPPGQFSQTRFQGIWWGTERIWADDFIRLKIPRRTLAPSGTDHIFPPSGPGKIRSDAWRELGEDDPADLGAGARGVFLRLEGIFAVDIPTEDGEFKKEARVCGMLYELADEDWEDPQLTTTPGMSEPVQNATVSDAQGQKQAGPSSSNSAAVAGGSAAVGSRDNYLLPQAPDGYKFRPIMRPGLEFVGAMGLISGRYYPRILSHPRLRPLVDEAQKDNMAMSDNLWALEGLSGGYFNSMDPVRYKKSRYLMMQDADRDALSLLRGYAEQKQRESSGLNGNPEVVDPMDVDIDEIYA